MLGCRRPREKSLVLEASPGTLHQKHGFDVGVI